MTHSQINCSTHSDTITTTTTTTTTLTNTTMSDGRVISNARGTDTLAHVYIKGRKVLRSDLPRTHPAFRAAVTKRPATPRRDRAAIDARILGPYRRAPHQIFTTRSPGPVNWERDIMITEIDLRDDKLRSFDGDAALKGAIFKDDGAASKARHIHLLIWVEIPGNWQRANELLWHIVDSCPRLQRLDIEIAAESDLALSKAVMHEVCMCQDVWKQDRVFKSTIRGSIVDRE
jgi:hypothetical protein